MHQKCSKGLAVTPLSLSSYSFAQYDRSNVWQSDCSPVENSSAALQHLLLLMPRIRDLLGKLLRWCCHVRFPAYVRLVLTHINALDFEVRFDILQVLVLVQSDLHSASSCARALHPVLVQFDLDDMTSA